MTFGIRARLTGCSMVPTGSSGSLRGWIVISHIGGWGLERRPYMSMLTLTSKTHFGAMRGCQEQIREVRGRKQTNILLVGWGVTAALKAFGPATDMTHTDGSWRTAHHCFESIGSCYGYDPHRWVLLIPRVKADGSSRRSTQSDFGSFWGRTQLDLALLSRTQLNMFSLGLTA